jgi:hypothetical protein
MAGGDGRGGSGSGEIRGGETQCAVIGAREWPKGGLGGFGRRRERAERRAHRRRRRWRVCGLGGTQRGVAAFK